jgi:hypothetical protein
MIIFVYSELSSLRINLLVEPSSIKLRKAYDLDFIGDGDMNVRE